MYFRESPAMIKLPIGLLISILKFNEFCIKTLALLGNVLMRGNLTYRTNNQLYKYEKVYLLSQATIQNIYIYRCNIVPAL